MMHSDNELQYLNEVCKIIIKDCGHTMVWIGYAQNDKNKSVKPVASWGFDEGYLEKMKITWNDTVRGRGPTGTAIRTGKPYLCKNMQTDPAFKPWREEAIKRGYASSIVLPLISDGKPFGAISIYSKECDPFSDKEINLLSDLADDLAYGISFIRLIESQKRSLEIIIESEEKYKELVTNARSLIIKLDTKGRFTFINEFAQTFFGFTENEVLGKPVIDTIVPQTESTGRNLDKMVENISEDPDKYSVNINENIKKNGERVWIEWHNKALFDKNGNRTGHIAIGMNITERKKAEEALKESEEKLWSVLNAAKESIYMFDKDGKFTITNATGLRRLNKSDEKELIGHHFSEFMSGELASQRQANIDGVFMSGDPLEFEDERSGHIFHHNFYPVFKDKKVSKVVTYSIDITEQIKAEKDLQSTKNYLENLINYANAPIIVWNPDTRIQLFNNAFEHLTGYSAAEVEGKKLDLLFPKASLRESNAKIKDALTENWRTLEIPILTKNREIRTVLWNSANIYDNDKKTVLATIAQGNDITERIKAEQKVNERTKELEIANAQLHQELTERNLAEEALKKSEVQLKELNATKDKFFNIVAHDLKNPFTSLLGSSELLSHNIDQMDHEKIKTLALILNDSAKSGYAILQNLLDWSRSQTGLLRYNPEKINLRKLIDENILNLELFSANKEIEMHSEVKEDLVILADRNMINTILRNLLSNAVKFTNRHGKVVIKATIDSHEITISIKDSGVGISQENIEKLFRIDTKYSMPGTENEQGTGLGLKLSKEFVEKQGGKIWVSSVEKKGSEFKFSIPFKEC